MSSWLSWWGGTASQKQKQAKVKDAVVGLRAHRDMLEKKAAYLQSQVDDLEAQTKAALKKDPNGKGTSWHVFFLTCGMLGFNRTT